MQVFGCAWKINFQLTVCFNGFDPEISFSQNFQFKPFPDSRVKRERERERESPDHAFNFAGEPRAQIMPRTQSPDHAFDFADLRTDLRPRAFDPSIYEPTNRFSTQSLRPTDLRTHEPIFDPEPSTSSATQSLRATNPQTDLSLYVILIFCVILIDPRIDLRFCVILIFYFLSLISDFFCCCCCGGVGGGVLVVFLLCGGGFCVGGGGK